MSALRGFMLKAIRDSHRAELALLARDLHDHAAHATAVAIQNLELHEVHASQDVARAQEVDVEMPGPSARETVGKLRQQHSDTQVIVLTMHDQSELALELLNQGAAAYLIKTIARQKLITAVRSVAASRDNILLSVDTVKRHLTNIYTKLWCDLTGRCDQKGNRRRPDPRHRHLSR